MFKNLIQRWELFATLAIFLFGFSVFSRKVVFNNNSYSSSIFFFMLFSGIFFIMSSCYIYYNEKTEIMKFYKNKRDVFIITLASFLFVSGIIIKNKAFQLAPNAAYVDAYMEPFKTALIYLLSILLLSTAFKPKSLIGLAIAIIGIVILIKNQ